MELRGPSLSEVTQKLEYFLKCGSSGIIVQVLDPHDSVQAAKLQETSDPSTRRIDVYPDKVGIYSITIFGDPMGDPVLQKECFCYNFVEERCYFDEIQGSLTEVHISLEMRLHGAIRDQISAQAHLVTQVSGKAETCKVIQCSVTHSSERSSDFWFRPLQYGSYDIRFFCGHKSIAAPRPLVHVVDFARLKLIHSFTTESCFASIKQKVSFIFDLSGAPSNYLQAWVESPDKSRIDILLYGEEKEDKIGQLRCDFIPTAIGTHSLLACYGDELFEKCPLTFQVYNSDFVTILDTMPALSSTFTVGDTLSVAYDCSQCGPGELTVSPSVHLTSSTSSHVPVEQTGPNSGGVISCTVSLSLPGTCVIDAFYNNEHIKHVTLKLRVRPSEDERETKEFSDKTDQVIKNSSMNGTQGGNRAETVKIPTKVRRAKKPNEQKQIELPLPSDKIDSPNPGSIANKSADHDVPSEEPVVLGEGLLHAEIGKVAKFIFDPQKGSGQLMIDVKGPRSLTKCLIRPDPTSGCYNIEYFPNEIGLYVITILWNDVACAGSPFQVTVTDPSKIRCCSHLAIFDDVLLITPNQRVQIDFEYDHVGKGKFSAIMIQGHGKTMLRCWCNSTKKTWSFVIKTASVGAGHVDVLWNEVALGRITVKCGIAPDSAAGGLHNTMDSSLQVILKGRGLREAWVGERAEFWVDAVNAGKGELVANLCGLKEAMSIIVVEIQSLTEGEYRCSYLPEIEGCYSLTISWGQKIIKGSPFSVKVWDNEPHRRVQCRGEGLERGTMGEETLFEIDLGRSREDEDALSVWCVDPRGRSISCDLIRKRSNLYQVRFTAPDHGRHQLNVLYGDKHVPGSPFYPIFADGRGLSKIIVSGPGLQSTTLGQMDSHFTVDAREAGIGKLTVQVKGPQESFRVEVQKDRDNDRLIHCSYNPVTKGEYIITVCWNGVLTIGSPFVILLK